MSARESLHRQTGTVEGNEVRIDAGTAEQVIGAPNTDRAATYVGTVEDLGDSATGELLCQQLEGPAADADETDHCLENAVH